MKPLHHIVPALALALCLILAGCGSKVTKDNFDKISTGMTESQVEAIMGKGEEQSAAVAVPGMSVSAKTIVWKDGEKSISVVFTNGKVSGKASNRL
jgi:hypothetical protein